MKNTQKALCRVLKQFFSSMPAPKRQWIYNHLSAALETVQTGKDNLPALDKISPALSEEFSYALYNSFDCSSSTNETPPAEQVEQEEITFHNVLITICAASPEDAYTKMCNALATIPECEYRTSTYSTLKEEKQISTSKLWDPK